MKNQIGPMERPGLLASSSKVMIQSRQKKAIESISQAADSSHSSLPKQLNIMDFSYLKIRMVNGL